VGITYLMESEAEFFNTWITTRSTDDKTKFYKEIATLAVRCKTLNDASRMCQMSRAEFRAHLNNAKQIIKDEFNSRTNINHLDSDYLV
jgi:hypothetical protein